MKTAWRRFIQAGTLMCALLLFLMASTSHAQTGCYTYTNDIRYCNVVKIKNGVCVHNRWGQYHNGQTGPYCEFCYDTVNNDLDFLVDHFETPLENGCYPYNDCQVGTVYTCI
jgi:hypothetical protein